MQNKMTCLALAAAMLLATSAAHALTNGSFESPGTGCQGATTSLPGWTVSTGNIDIVNSACSAVAAADGTYYLDLTGTVGSGPGGTITQSIATTAGTQYTLGFYFGGNPQWQTQPGNPFSSYLNDGPVKSMEVLVNGSQLGATYTIDTTGNLWTNAGWTHESTTFTATSSSTSLAFESLDSGTYGPLLDGVSVTAATVPEPGAIGLLGLGFAVVSVLRKRRSARG